MFYAHPLSCSCVHCYVGLSQRFQVKGSLQFKVKCCFRCRRFAGTRHRNCSSNLVRSRVHCPTAAPVYARSVPTPAPTPAAPRIQWGHSWGSGSDHGSIVKASAAAEAALGAAQAQAQAQAAAAAAAAAASSAPGRILRSPWAPTALPSSSNNRPLSPRLATCNQA